MATTTALRPPTAVHSKQCAARPQGLAGPRLRSQRATLVSRAAPGRPGCHLSDGRAAEHLWLAGTGPDRLPGQHSPAAGAGSQQSRLQGRAGCSRWQGHHGAPTAAQPVPHRHARAVCGCLRHSSARTASSGYGSTLVTAVPAQVECDKPLKLNFKALPEGRGLLVTVRQSPAKLL